MASMATLILSVDGTGAIRTLNKFTGSAHNAGRATEHFERTTKNLTNSLRVLGGYFGVRQLVEYADTWTLINARVKLVTSSVAQTNKVHEQLYQIAQRTRNTLAATSVLYTRVALNADQLGRSHEELLQVVESVNAAMLLSGATGVESAQAMRQLAQALGSGRVQGDEFRTMMEAMPLVARAIADEMGVAMGDLYKLSKKGLIDVQTVLDALIKKHGELTERSADMPWTIGQVFEVLNNAVTRMVGIMNFATDGTKRIGQGILWMADNVQILAGVVGGAAIAGVAYRTALWGWVGAMKALAFWTNRARIQQALMTAMDTIRSWFQLARAIRSAGDAMALMSLVSGGVVKALAAGAAMIAGYVAYQAIVDKITKATEDWTNAQADLAELLGEGVTGLPDEKEIKQRYAIEDMIREAQQALVLSGLAEEGAERMQIRFEAVNQIIEARREFQGELLEATIAAIRWEERLKLQAYETELAMEAAKEAVKERMQILERFTKNLQRSMGDTFEKILDDGINKFGDLFKAIKTMFLRLVAEMAAAQMMRRVGGTLTGLLSGMMGFSAAELAAQEKAGKMSADAVSHITEAMGGESLSVEIKSITASASKSWTAQLAQYLGPALGGFGVGQMVGGYTSNRALGTIGGAASGAATGAAIGSVVPGVGTLAGGIVGGIAGAIGGFFGSSKEKKRQEEMLRQNTLALHQNSMKLEAMRRAFQGDFVDYFTDFLNSNVLFRARNAKDNKLSEMSARDQAQLLAMAGQMGITILDQEGKFIAGALNQLNLAIRMTIEQMTTFGRNLDDITARQDAYNKLFNMEDNPQRQLNDAMEVLTTLAPELADLMGLTGVDGSSVEGRQIILDGLRSIYDLIVSGDLTPELLGAFTDKGQLLDAILRVKDGLDEFDKQLNRVTTDFPRAMDIVFYEQLFGKFGGPARLRDGEVGTGSGGSGGGPGDPRTRGGWTIHGGITIYTDGSESGEEVLQKLERAAERRRTRGGRVGISDMEAF